MTLNMWSLKNTFKNLKPPELQRKGLKLSFKHYANKSLVVYTRNSRKYKAVQLKICNVINRSSRHET